MNEYTPLRCVISMIIDKRMFLNHKLRLSRRGTQTNIETNSTIYIYIYPIYSIYIRWNLHLCHSTVILGKRVKLIHFPRLYIR